MDSIQQKMISRLALVTTVIIAILLITQPTVDTNQPEDSIISVTSIQVQCSHNPKLVKLYGKVIPHDPKNIDSEVSSSVLETLKKSGDQITAGETLIILDNEKILQQQSALKLEISSIEKRLTASIKSLAMEIELLKHETQLLKRAHEELTRYQSLSDAYKSKSMLKTYEDAVSKQEKQVLIHQQKITQYEQQITSDKNQRSITLTQLAQSELDLDNTVITAPIDGIIQSSHIKVGDVVSPGSAMLTIVNPNRVYINAFIPTQYLTQLNVGTSKAYLDHPQRQPLALQRLNQSIQDGSAHLDASFIFLEQTPKLALGEVISLLVEIDVSIESCPVPESSIYQDSYIYEINEQLLNEIRIEKLGLTYNDGQTLYLVSAEEDLTNKTILTTRLTNPKTGTRVKHE
jgi:multidrug efflux pump subunit AcrA (membrane-fusion protein)